MARAMRSTRLDDMRRFERLLKDGPVLLDGARIYPVNAAQFTDVLLDCAEESVALLGGCCGTTPEYIAAAARRIGQTEKGQ